MANEDLQAQFNHLLWQLGQLHEEAKVAGQIYQEKLKAIRKRSEKLNMQLHNVGSVLRKRHANGVSPFPSPQAPAVGSGAFANPPWEPLGNNG